MKEEAHCIFHKAAHGHKEMNAAEGTAALDKWCHWKYPTASAAQCKGTAIKGDELLNSHFGHNNEIDEKEFYNAYLYVKGHGRTLDFIGCDGADWGDKPAMKEEAHCIFHKAAHGHKEMNAAEGTAALDKWCHWKYPTASAAKCKGGAIKADELLNSHFGHNNEIDEKEFYQAYLYVKGHGRTLDFIGCDGADWGDVPAMKEEAHCIFHKAAHGHKEMNAAEGTAALDK